MTVKILVVDDEPAMERLLKLKLRRKIEAGEFALLYTHNGEEAMQLLERDRDIDILVTDINMPKMNGLTLLKEIHQRFPLIKSIVVSAYGDMKNIRTAMNWGAFDFITKPIDFKDLECTLQKTIDLVIQIRETANAIRQNNILKMYVDENVLNFMTTETFQQKLMVNETIDGTVLFVDICGFTAISEKYPPDTVAHMLNCYFDRIVLDITQHGGQVDKFMGDAVMGIFRRQGHAERALFSAIDIRENLKEIKNVAGIDFSPNVSVGVNSGEMISGNFGSESLARLDYTVIGDVVNTAARFQAAANPGEIVIGERLYEQLGNRFHCEPLGAVILKNKVHPATIYNVVDRLRD